MKFYSLLAAAFTASALSASAFSLDFTGLDLDGSIALTDQDALVLEVAGFGNVAFGVAEKDGVAVVDDNLGVAAIEFDDTKTITVSFFAGIPVENVMVSFVGVDQGETPVYTPTGDFSGIATIPTGAVGIQSITFDRAGPQIPEPSTAILGLLGGLALLRRRR